MITEIMQLADIKAAAYNPRKELKPGDTEYEALAKSIDRFGLVEPLIVNKTTGTLVGGHQRLSALKARGETESEVVIIEVSEQDEKLLNVALNKIEGDWDYSKLEQLFSEFSEEDISFTGFSQEELTNLFGEAEVSNGYSYEDDSDEEEPEEKKKTECKPKSTEFKIYLSFPNKELAEAWLEKEGVDEKFGGVMNITMCMEGTDYGSRN